MWVDRVVISVIDIVITVNIIRIHQSTAIHIITHIAIHPTIHPTPHPTQPITNITRIEWHQHGITPPTAYPTQTILHHRQRVSIQP